MIVILDRMERQIKKLQTAYRKKKDKELLKTLQTALDKEVEMAIQALLKKMDSEKPNLVV
jgi:hypothetical protein